MPVISEFVGSYEFLDNAYFSPLNLKVEFMPKEWRKIAVASMLHGIAVRKLLHFHDMEYVRQIPDPQIAWQEAQHLPQNPLWPEFRVKIMCELLAAKFFLLVELYRQEGYIPPLTLALLQTNHADIVYRSPYPDDLFWGGQVGGQNTYGRLLMLQRDAIRKLISRLDRAQAKVPSHVG